MDRLLIPPFGIYERRPPPLRVTVGVEGWLKWELINRKGRVHRGGEQHNLILNQGLDQIATHGLVDRTGNIGSNVTAGIQYAAVGTDSTAPAVTDTGLGGEVARTNVGSTGTILDESISRSADGVYDHVRTYEFDFAEAIGNLTEWGISPIATAGGNLYARELFRDGGGSPETVTKTADDKLRLVYTRRTTITPTAWTAGSLAITGHGTIDGDYRLIGGASDGSGSSHLDLRLFSWLATGTEPSASGGSNWSGGGLLMLDSDQSGVAYDNVTAITGDNTSPIVGIEVHASAAAYSPGAYSRTGATLKYGTTRGNFEHHAIGLTGHGRTGISHPRLGFVFDYDPGEQWTKDNFHELRVTLPTVTWARV